MSDSRVIERVRAFIRLAYPDDMTPTAKRMLESILDEEEGAHHKQCSGRKCDIDTEKGANDEV